LVGWLVGLLVGWLVGWLVGFSIFSTTATEVRLFMFGIRFWFDISVRVFVDDPGRSVNPMLKKAASTQSSHQDDSPKFQVKLVM